VTLDIVEEKGLFPDDTESLKLCKVSSGWGACSLNTWERFELVHRWMKGGSIVPSPIFSDF
jgi:hypothetical protein